MDSMKNHLTELTSKLGGKGAGLVWLRYQGFSTPDFVVIETEKFLSWKQAGVLPNLQSEFETIQSWGNVPLAVRSSSTLEDSASKSFAGQFKTLLDVKFSDLKTAIIEVFKSSAEICQNYSENIEQPFAVVVQRLLKSECSGVAFSRRPLGDTSLVLIESIWGLGQSLVDGSVIPDRFEFDRFGQLIRKDLSPENKERPSLSSEQSLEIVKTVLAIEGVYGSPVDTEWSFENGKLQVLQVRPITQKFEALTYYCDSNLIESYPGVSSPLTISVVKRVYTRIFLDSAKFLGASPQRIEALTPFYRSMIGSFAGHLYYNMNSYFAALSALPGGKKNLSSWLSMIGSEAKAEIPTTNFSPFSFSEYFKMSLAFFRLVFLRSFQISKFQKNVAKYLSESKLRIEKAQSSLEATRLFLEFLNPSFSLEVIPLNDLVLMKMVERKSKSKTKVDLKTHSYLSSLEPEWELEKLTTIYSNPKALLESQEFKIYLDKYGDRCFEDLKLESQSFRQNPESLVRMLRFGEPSKPKELSKRTKRGIARAISHREELRLTRSQYFGLLRSAAIKVAEKLAEEEGLQPDFAIEMIWGLELEDLQNYAARKVSAKELLSRSNLDWFSNTKDFPEYLCSTGNDFTRSTQVTVSKGSLRGTGASSGSIRGVALVVTDPRRANPDLIHKTVILVTPSTDPAWVFLMCRAGGLLSERGSLLSHTAIIGRELNLPTVVAAKDATKIIKSGDIIRIDGATGEIEIEKSETQNRLEAPTWGLHTDGLSLN